MLESEFGVSATVRGRRGVDVDAGCGQLKSVIEKRRREGREKTKTSEEVEEKEVDEPPQLEMEGPVEKGPIDLDLVDADSLEVDFDSGEATRLLSLVSPPATSVPKTKITDPDAAAEVERRIKKVRKRVFGRPPSAALTALPILGFASNAVNTISNAPRSAHRSFASASRVSRG